MVVTTMPIGTEHTSPCSEYLHLHSRLLHSETRLANLVQTGDVTIGMSTPTSFGSMPLSMRHSTLKRHSIPTLMQQDLGREDSEQEFPISVIGMLTTELIRSSLADTHSRLETRRALWRSLSMQSRQLPMVRSILNMYLPIVA